MCICKKLSSVHVLYNVIIYTKIPQKERHRTERITCNATPWPYPSATKVSASSISSRLAPPGASTISTRKWLQTHTTHLGMLARCTCVTEEVTPLTFPRFLNIDTDCAALTLPPLHDLGQMRIQRLVVMHQCLEADHTPIGQTAI